MEPTDTENWWEQDSEIVGGVAAFLEKLIVPDEELPTIIQDWLLSSSGGGVGEPLALRRAIITVISKDTLVFREVFRKSLQQFADKLWIKHTPILRQEGASHLHSVPCFYFSLLPFHLYIKIHVFARIQPC